MASLKKIFPKLKKKLKGFLTDESGKITKKDALVLAAGIMLLGGIDSVAADLVTTHTSSVACSGHMSQAAVNSATIGAAYHSNPSAVTVTSPVSTTINGHSSTMSAPATYDAPHASGYATGGHLNQGHASGNAHNSHSSHSNTYEACYSCM